MVEPICSISSFHPRLCNHMVITSNCWQKTAVVTKTTLFVECYTVVYLYIKRRSLWGQDVHSWETVCLHGQRYFNLSTLLPSILYRISIYIVIWHQTSTSDEVYTSSSSSSWSSNGRPERDVTYIVLSVYLHMLIHRYPLNRKHST